MTDERPVSDLLASLPTPAHDDAFWSRLDARLDTPADDLDEAPVTDLLTAVSAPDHEESFWARLDAKLEAVSQETSQSSVFESGTDTGPAAGASVFSRDTARVVTADGKLRSIAQVRPVARARRRPPFLNPRFVAAAALVAIVLGASLVIASTRGSDGPSIAAPIITTTTGAPGAPPAPAPAISESSTVQSVQPVAASGRALASSSNGKYVYMTVPAPGESRCGRGAVTLVAQPLEGGASTPVLTDRVFRSPSFSTGPKGQLLVTDPCDGATVVRSGETGQLLVDRSISAAGRTFDVGSFGLAGSQVFVRDAAKDEWFAYDTSSGRLTRRDDIPAKVVRVAELESGELLVVREDAGKRLNVFVGATAVAQVRAGAAAADAVSVSADGRNIAVAAENAVVVAFAGLRVARLDGKARTVSWSPDSASLLVAPDEGGLDVVTRPDKIEELARTSLGYRGTIDRLVALPGQTAFVVTAGDGAGDLSAGATARLQMGQ